MVIVFVQNGSEDFRVYFTASSSAACHFSARGPWGGWLFVSYNTMTAIIGNVIGAINCAALEDLRPVTEMNAPSALLLGKRFGTNEKLRTSSEDDS
jgi:hypothetical protein